MNKTSFTVSKIYSIYLMTHIGRNDCNTWWVEA